MTIAATNRTLAATLPALLLPVAAHPAPDSAKLLAAQRQRIESADYRIAGRLIRIDANGTHLPVHVLLEMRPNGEDMIQIAHPGDRTPVTLPFEKWKDGLLGTDFSGEYFLEATFFSPGQAPLGATRLDERNCDELKSAPRHIRWKQKRAAGPVPHCCASTEVRPMRTSD